LFWNDELQRRTGEDNLTEAFKTADKLFKKSDERTHYVISYRNGDSYKRVTYELCNPEI
jgi:hypothetical protein